MEAQKNPKMTVKSLHQEFNILKEGLFEIKNVKDKVEALEKRLDDLEKNVKVLKNRLDVSEMKETKVGG